MNKPSDLILLVQKNRIRQIGLIVLSSILLGLMYPLINKEFSNPLAFFNAFIIGLLGGLAIAFHEDYRSYKRIKREHFLVKLVKSVTLYTVYFALIVAAVIALTYGLSSGQGILRYILGPEFQQFIFRGDYVIIVLYALFFSWIVSFTLIMSRKIESRVMFNMISGKYHKPVEEERIFMSIDLNNSSRIAEDLEEEAYFDFLNKFYLDLTPAIIATHGQIYRYVGDQVLISWPVGTTYENTACLRTYFIARNELRKKKEEYILKWGLVPSFKAVFHAGKVVAGEIGDFKSQFVFHGDALHKLQLMEKHCKSLGVKLLLSSVYADMIDLPLFYQLKECPQLHLEHAAETIILYTVVQSVQDPIEKSLNSDLN